jgi:probable DNA metabolism protein
MLYAYDDSFEGLLSALYFYYTTPEVIITSLCNLPPLLNAETLETNMRYTEKFAERIIKRFGYTAYRNVYYAYLSESATRERDIIDYLDSLIRQDGKYAYKIHAYRHKVEGTIHLYKGFLRFKDAGKFLYAEMEPEYDILIFLARYFATRLNHTPFIICDRARNTALLHNGSTFVIHYIDESVQFSDVDDEALVQTLYRSFFNSVSIQSRPNERNQRRQFPLKFRKYALEFDNHDNKR